MARSRTPVVPTVLALACCAGLTACGDEPQDDATGPAVPVEVTATFAERQALSAPERLAVRVRNTGDRAIPDVAVVLGGLYRTARDATGSADPRRPVWIVDGAPAGATSGTSGTWAVGPLPAGATRTYRWRLTPAVAGRHRLDYRVSGAAGTGSAVQDARGSVRVRVGQVSR